jgi:hypothetical protein
MRIALAVVYASKKTAEKKMAALILDSDPNRRKTVVEALERSGLAFEIKAAAPGGEVTRQISEGAYDVILDCGQPEKDRLAMLRNIQQEDHPTQVIVVTDEGDGEEARRAMEEGASDYVMRTEAYLTTLPLVFKKAHQRCHLLAALQRRESKPVSARPLPPQGETTATERHSHSNEALKDALTRMQEALEEVNTLLEKSQIRFDNQASNLEQEVQRQNRELWTINAIAEAVSQSFDLDEILNNVVSKLTAVMGIEASWVYLVEEQGKKEPELRLKAHQGVSERFAQGMTWVRMGEGPNGQVAMSGEPLLIEDLVESNLRTKLVMEQEGLRSFAQVPMRAKDRVIGVIAVASHMPRPFAPHEVHLLTSISNQVGIAVEKIQLYHQVREYAQQQEKSNQVLQEINSMLMESQAKLEAQMAAVKKAETEIQQRNRELSALNAIVSHELRSPLASIIGYLDLMLDEETGPLNEEQSEYLSIIELNANRLNHLINDILDISRIEAGRIDLAMVPLDVIEIARETVVTMQPQAKAKGIKMTISVAEGPALSKACSDSKPHRKARPEQTRRVKGLPLIQGDPDRMRQVLVNVLGNAIKFTPQGGRVEISGRCLAAGEQPPPPGPELATTSDWLLVSVTDTGVGIAAEELDRVFEKFYQIEGFADRSSQGSGLGLSIAQGIVEAHGGLIWAQSAGENQGSTFTFALPVPG